MDRIFRKKKAFFKKNSVISVVRPFIILLSFCTKNGIIKLLFLLVMIERCKLIVFLIFDG